jgi:hypothetical protein
MWKILLSGTALLRGITAGIALVDASLAAYLGELFASSSWVSGFYSWGNLRKGVIESIKPAATKPVFR